MKGNGLVLNYTVAQYKIQMDKCKESKISNELNRECDTEEPYVSVVSDLTYIRDDKR